MDEIHKNSPAESRTILSTNRLCCSPFADATHRISGSTGKQQGGATINRCSRGRWAIGNARYRMQCLRRSSCLRHQEEDDRETDELEQFLHKKRVWKWVSSIGVFLEAAACVPILILIDANKTQLFIILICRYYILQYEDCYQFLWLL